MFIKTQNHSFKKMNMIKILIPVVDVVDGVRSSRQSEEGFGFGERGAAVVAAAITVERAGPGDRA